MPIATEVDDRAGSRIEVTDELRALIERLIDRWSPLQVWLFGSRARGHASPHSDWDLLVVVPDDTPEEDRDYGAVWDARRGSEIPVDLVVFTRAEFLADQDVTNTLPYEVSVAGVLLYESRSRRRRANSSHG